MNSCLDRYFYSIEADADGERFIHLSGNVYLNDVDETEKNFRIAEWTFLYIGLSDLSEMLENDTFYEYVNERVNYLSDITKEEAFEICDQYFDGKPGHPLPLSEVSESTPCGDYWF